MDHHFNIEVAEKHGVNIAIFMNNLAFWLMTNKSKNKNFHEGRYWSYNTIESFLAFFPYWSVKNIRTIIKNAKESDLIIIGRFSKRKNDMTQWFTLSDYGMSFYSSINSMQVLPAGSIQEDVHLPKPANEAGRGFQGVQNDKTPVASHLPKPANRCAQTGRALPYNKPDKKLKDKRSCPSADELVKFEIFWSVYPRKQKRKDALKSWSKNNLCQKTEIIVSHLRKRLETEWSGKSINYIPLPASFLNAEGWNDEIITHTNIVPITKNTISIQPTNNYKKNELKSTVIDFGPGHPTWDDLYGPNAKYKRPIKDNF